VHRLICKAAFYRLQLGCRFQVALWHMFLSAQVFLMMRTLRDMSECSTAAAPWHSLQVH
jgi:hypothetical protein